MVAEVKATAWRAAQRAGYPELAFFGRGRSILLYITKAYPKNTMPLFSWFSLVSLAFFGLASFGLAFFDQRVPDVNCPGILS